MLKKTLKLSSIVMIGLSCLSTAQSFEKNDFRHLKRHEISIPTGSLSLADFFSRLKVLNPDAPIQWPEVQNQDKIMFRPGYEGGSAKIELDEFAKIIALKVPNFNKQYHWDIGRRNISLNYSGVSKVNRVESVVMAMPSWTNDLPRVDTAVNVKKGDTLALNPGFYHQPVIVDGDLKLEGQKFAFSNLKVNGNMNLKDQSIAGERLELAGTVTLSQDSQAQFDTVNANGTLKLQSGSSISVKDIIMGENGDLILGENADLILN